MKKLNLVLLFLFIGSMSFLSSQTIRKTVTNADAYEGTWVYCANDTVFKIVLQKTVVDTGILKEVIMGNYSLSVNGQLIDNYIFPMPRFWKPSEQSISSCHFYIEASDNYKKTLLNTTFYDQHKRHFDGKGILGGKIELLSPTTLHWTLDEWEGVRAYIEAYESLLLDDYTPIGFSVPTDAIMFKEKAD